MMKKKEMEAKKLHEVAGAEAEQLADLEEDGELPLQLAAGGELRLPIAVLAGVKFGYVSQSHRMALTLAFEAAGPHSSVCSRWRINFHAILGRGFPIHFTIMFTPPKIPTQSSTTLQVP